MSSSHGALNERNLERASTPREVWKNLVSLCFWGIPCCTWEKGSVTFLLTCDNLFSCPSPCQQRGLCCIKYLKWKTSYLSLLLLFFLITSFYSLSIKLESRICFITLSDELLVQDTTESQTMGDHHLHPSPHHCCHYNFTADVLK